MQSSPFWAVLLLLSIGFCAYASAALPKLRDPTTAAVDAATGKLNSDQIDFDLSHALRTQPVNPWAPPVDAHVHSLLVKLYEEAYPLVQSKDELNERDEDVRIRSALTSLKLAYRRDSGRVRITVTAVDIDRAMAELASRADVRVQYVMRNSQSFEADVDVSALPLLEAMGQQGVFSGVRGHLPPNLKTGLVRAQGDFTGQTARLRNFVVSKGTPFDGSGVRIGVISDSFNGTGQAQQSFESGDLSPDTIVVLNDTDIGTDEGRAMMELIRDFAPGATLVFHTCGSTNGDFAYAVQSLADPKKGNCSIVVDDIEMVDEPFWAPSPVQIAQDTVYSNLNTLCITSAGNSAHDGFDLQGIQTRTDSSIAESIQFIIWDNTNVIRNPVTLYGAATLLCNWDDPWLPGQVKANIGIYITQTNGTSLLDSSIDDNIQQGIAFNGYGFDPYRVGETNVDLLIGINGTTPNRLRCFVSSGAGILAFGYSNGSTAIVSHAQGPNTVAAAAYTYKNLREPAGYSSFGPATQLFDENWARLATPVIRPKPDMGGVSGCDTSFFGTDTDGNDIPNFDGTSAAAPYLGAVAALIWQAQPQLTNRQVWDVMLNATQGIYNASVNQVGAGCVNAWQALNPTASTASVFGTTYTFKNDETQYWLDNSWQVESDACGAATVMADKAPAGSNSLKIGSYTESAFCDNANGNYATATWTVDMSGISPLRRYRLAFDHRKESDREVGHPMPFAPFDGDSYSDGVAVSIDDGTTWYPIFNLTGGHSSTSYKNIKINLDTAVSIPFGLDLASADVKFRFYHYEAPKGNASGFFFSNVRVEEASGATGLTPTLPLSALRETVDSMLAFLL